MQLTCTLWVVDYWSETSDGRLFPTPYHYQGKIQTPQSVTVVTTELKWRHNVFYMT